MKKIFMVLSVLVFTILMFGCVSEQMIESEDVCSYEITNITQGYGSYDSIEGLLKNTGKQEMKEIIILAIMEINETDKKVLFGTVEKENLRAGESAKFIVTSTVGSGDIRLNKIKYRVYCD